MDEGMKLLNKGEYESSIEKYRQAQLILSEIQFPIDSVQEMIFNLQEKKREADVAKQQRIEAQIQRDQEQKGFQTQIAEKMEHEEEKMKVKKVEVQKQ